MSLDLITPQWPAPAHVHAATTTRSGGVSPVPFDSLNMAGHVGDEAVLVATNRQRLAEALLLPEKPHWLSQVHGTGVVTLDEGSIGLPEADASMTRESGCVCAVLTADCLPVLFCDRAGTRVAAAHAGWRGLAAGVLESVVEVMDVPGDEILAWLGPAIGPRSFEVGEEVYQAFIGTGVEQNPEASSAFVPSIRSAGVDKKGRWLADLYQLARLRLKNVGVTSIYGGGFCTYEDQ
ncbi:MAG: peptidoglycan editing factor PgeF, partial [Gammaproteobacteria bacterium]